MKKIGCIGQGFVGNAIREKFQKSFKIVAWDKQWSSAHMFDANDQQEDNNDDLTEDGLKDVVGYADIIFVCVPTPMYEDGECDTRIVESVIEDIAKEAEFLNKEVIAIVKSTVPPGTTEMLNGISTKVGVTFSPEFLTEANAVQDFENQNRIVLGIDYVEYVEPILNIFKTAFPNADHIVVASKEAEMVKYTTNLFLATKVSFFNDIYSVCEKLGIKYDNVVEATMHDPRIGKSHYMVPGPDGDRGFGGHCFPGDHQVITTEGNIELHKLYETYKNGEDITVISYDENVETRDFKKVKEVTVNEFSGELLRFSLENGTGFECTPEHIFPVLREEKLILAMAKDITEFDILFNDFDYGYRMKITKIEKVKFTGPVYNLELESNSEKDDLFWVEGRTGTVTHNCFPKDISALLYIATNMGLAIPTITGAQITNEIVRKDKDWMKMEGRAVSKREKKD